MSRVTTGGMNRTTTVRSDLRDWHARRYLRLRDEDAGCDAVDFFELLARHEAKGRTMDAQAKLMEQTLIMVDRAVATPCCGPGDFPMTAAEFERRLREIERKLEEFRDGVRADIRAILEGK